MKHFSIIIPAFNEEKGISGVIDSLKALQLPAEIIIVDDGSTDATAEVAAKHGIKVLRHPANAGYGKSLKDGILAASHDTIVITDADGSYPIDAIETLVKTLDQGFDMVVGARQGTGAYDSLLKIPARLFFKFLVEFTTGRKIPDINSGLRAFRKSQVLPYFPDLCQGFSFTTTITLIYLLTGKYVRYIDVAYHKRVGTSKVRIFRDTLRTLQYIVEVIGSYNPLKLYVLLTGFIGLLCVAALIASIVLSSVMYLLVASVFLVGACIIFAIGVQADVLAKLRRQQLSASLSS